MVQTNYSLTQKQAFAGMKVDMRFDTIESHLIQAPADEVVEFGLGLMSCNDDPARLVRKPSKLVSVLTASVALQSPNSTIATINGDAMSAVAWNTDAATTMADLATEIETHDDVKSAVVDGEDITITGFEGHEIDASAISSGGSFPTWSQARSDPGVFRGICLHRHVELVNGVAAYQPHDSADICRKGMVWMPYVDAITPLVDETLYINLGINGERGEATNVSSDNIATGGKIRDVDTSLKILKAEINLP